MRLSGRPAWLVRICGGVWIALAPILWLMAAISSVKSESTYMVQLLLFSAVAITGLICGVWALGAQTWAARGLFALSSLGVLYFFGVAAYMLIFPFVPWSTLKEPGMASFPMALGLATLIAPPGVPFLIMAVAIRRALLASSHDLKGTSGSA